MTVCVCVCILELVAKSGCGFSLDFQAVGGALWGGYGKCKER